MKQEDRNPQVAQAYYPGQVIPPSGYPEAFKAGLRMAMEGGPNWKETNPKDALGSGRVPMGLFPDTAVIAGSMAFLEGALKYEPYNWRRSGVRASIYVEALRRHMAAWWNGEEMDAKSGLNHLWKAIACLAILIDAREYGMLTDDRHGALEGTEPVIDRMLDRLQKDVAEMKDRVSRAGVREGP